MKKLIFTGLLFLALFMNNAFGQTEKGTILLGSLNFNTANLEEDIPLSFNPHIGTFVSDNVAIGMNFSFLWEFGDESNDLVNALAPYLKFYVGKGTRGKFFGQIKPAIALYNDQFDDISYGIAINAGYAYFITKKISMDYSAQFTKIKDSNSYVSLNVGFNFHLGKSE